MGRLNLFCQKKEIDFIEKGYLIPAATLLLHRPAGANWQMWHNSGLAALGHCFGKMILLLMWQLIEINMVIIF